MGKASGENESGLFGILEFFRLSSVLIVLVHLFYSSMDLIRVWHFSSAIIEQFLKVIASTGLFEKNNAKMIALGLLLVSTLGREGRKNEKVTKSLIFLWTISGLILYFFNPVNLRDVIPINIIAEIYILTTITGYLAILKGLSLCSRLLNIHLANDIFNEVNESFPQEERLLKNEFSINLPSRYQLKGSVRKAWINIINPFRGILVMGTPGSGKTHFVIRHVINQHIQKGFSMLVYDFKFDDLSFIAFNRLKESKSCYSHRPSFHVINFDDLSRSNRCNPLEPSTMNDITDATEASRCIMLGLNREWIKQQGDFFIESPINFVTAIIWFLKKYKDGKFCTLPHAIELMQVEYEKLFPVLKTEPEIEVLINPFISAYQNDAMEQLEGQVASAKIGMARLSSPQLYWVLSASDFSLDINDPKKPKILCLANNPMKQQVYGAVLSLYITRLIRQINQKGKQKCSLVFDEFPTIYFNGIDSLLATARSNKISTCLGIQDYSQLKKDYGNEYASVIMNLAGNVISGQVMGETAKALSERFGRIAQIKESISLSRTDISYGKSSQMDFAIPASKISGLSSGEFVGMVADDPSLKIKLKAFHSEIQNPYHPDLDQSATHEGLPVLRTVDQNMVNQNYLQIKNDVAAMIESEIEILLNTPGISI